MIVHGEGERFQVSAVRGYTIPPDRFASTHWKQTLAVCVLDSFYCYRTIRQFASYRGAHQLARAIRLCDELNHEEAMDTGGGEGVG